MDSSCIMQESEDWETVTPDTECTQGERDTRHNGPLPWQDKVWTGIKEAKSMKTPQSLVETEADKQARYGNMFNRLILRQC